jgi:flagellar protein FliS
MVNTAHRQYLEAEVLGASPVKLVEILYRAAVESVAAARRHLRNGEIRERSRSITKASGIVNELMLSLDHARGGDISRGLVELYAYMQTRLIEANTRQIDPPLAEVEQLLNVLSEAWRAVPPMPETQVASAGEDAEYAPVSCVY